MSLSNIEPTIADAPENPEDTALATTPPTTAHIRSFVLRQGRVSAAQRRFYEEGMPRWGISYRRWRGFSVTVSK